MKTSEIREIKPSRISEPSPKPRKYMYVKILAYTVMLSYLKDENGKFIIFLISVHFDLGYWIIFARVFSKYPLSST